MYQLVQEHLDLPIAKTIDLLPHDGIEKLKGYVSFADRLKQLAREEDRLK